MISSTGEVIALKTFQIRSINSMTIAPNDWTVLLGCFIATDMLLSRLSNMNDVSCMGTNLFCHFLKKTNFKTVSLLP